MTRPLELWVRLDGDRISDACGTEREARDGWGKDVACYLRADTDVTDERIAAAFAFISSTMNHQPQLRIERYGYSGEGIPSPERFPKDAIIFEAAAWTGAGHGEGNVIGYGLTPREALEDFIRGALVYARRRVDEDAVTLADDARRLEEKRARLADIEAAVDRSR